MHQESEKPKTPQKAAFKWIGGKDVEEALDDGGFDT